MDTLWRMGVEDQVRRVIGDDVPLPAMARLLCQAFATYEPWEYIFGVGEAAGSAASEWLLHAVLWLAVAKRGACAYVNDLKCDGDVIGVAAGGLLIRLAGAGSHTLWEQACAGLLAAPLRLGIGATRRLLAFGSAVDALHAADTATCGAHFLIQNVGVLPAVQGKGHAGRMLRAMLADADEAGLPVYLFTGSVRNEKMYAKHGFVTQSSTVIGDEAAAHVVMRGMLRPPRVPHSK